MTEPAPKFDARLEEGVRYFEQMLEIMPDDRITLEFLVVAYDQLNEHEKSERAVIMLTGLLLKQGDFAAAEGLLPRLEAIDTDEAKILALKVRRLAAPGPELVPEKPKELTSAELAAEETRAAVEGEIALVELLRKNGLIGDDEEAGRVRDQIASTPPGFLVSALAILEKENLEQCEKCMAFLADRFSTPPVPVAAFDRKPDLVGKFPTELLSARGVVPFAKVGDVALVAVLNPADEKLCARLAEAMKCRLFLALPSAAETWLSSLLGEGASP